MVSRLQEPPELPPVMLSERMEGIVPPKHYDDVDF